METIAIYWEETIRIYGMTTQRDLTLFKLVYPTHRGVFWSNQFEALTSVTDKFFLLTAQSLSSEELQISLVVSKEATTETHTLFESELKSESHTSLSVVSEVELLYLHGPHFQDRYGIAEAAFTILEKKKLPLLASGCTGTSLNLVFPVNMAKEAAKSLGESFVVPHDEH